MARAKKRLSSSRASVFSEFALIAPIVVLVCSALIEIAGYWDAQVMANHAAWTVGRIAMVRGSDGLEFSSNISKKSKTGIAGSSMPDPLKKALASLDTAIQGANRFNNRANISTMFLMSTCGIGYYGGTPGKTISDGFTALCDAGVKALTQGIPDWIAGSITNMPLPSFIGGGESGIGGFVNKLVKQLVDKLVSAALKPIAEGIQKLLQKAFDKILGKDGIKIDKLFNGKSAAARFARQMYGAGSRMARAKSTIGKEVVTVEDMDDLNGSFMFAKRSKLKRLVYPLVADKESKSDGFFVTGAHGWPANDNGLAMIHVEINWPYEYGWLFPVVSGRGKVSKPPVATGHSMVFPQPDISNENLYSEGATAFAPGSYTNNASVTALDDLANEMKDYLKFVKYCMRYRICEDTLTLKDGVYRIVPAQYWKYISELKDLWPFDSGDRDSYPRGGDYGKCWSTVTDNSDQDRVARNLEQYFNSSSYRSKDYFYWDGSYHKRYGQSLCSMNGNANLGEWYAQNKGLRYGSDNENMYPDIGAIQKFASIFSKKQFAINAAIKGGVSSNWLYSKIVEFAKRNKVNVHNLVKWQEGHDLEAWERQDKEVHAMAQKAEKSFQAIKTLIQKEIKDIENMENGTSSWTGDEDDPVFDPNDEEVMKNPDAAAKKARAKWATLKANLKKKLLEVDAAAEALRKQWEQYVKDVNALESARSNCVGEYFAEGCINAFVRTKNKALFDAGNDASFKIPAGCMPYDIGKVTRDMLDKVNAYYDKLNTAYKLEVEYGAMMGLESAGQAKREGKSPDEVVDEADGVNDDTPGSLGPGSDPGNIIDKDRQTYKGGAWKWN